MSGMYYGQNSQFQIDYTECAMFQIVHVLKFQFQHCTNVSSSITSASDWLDQMLFVTNISFSIAAMCFAQKC
jgi:hypothetical protein